MVSMLLIEQLKISKVIVLLIDLISISHRHPKKLLVFVKDQMFKSHQIISIVNLVNKCRIHKKCFVMDVIILKGQRFA